ncbi:uncharacterized protein LOC123680754 isoform X2 [Harmonia axyridis]|uniref:uncharacterized protein LOC123680754 isoform X2 n=1 Tax=Harmonia axyridis TaxID=115357 RepID=UPI001E278BC1|nr:uncharacterized protein LOC123680754 isoform X2 [Harmonia axyridis]
MKERSIFAMPKTAFLVCFLFCGNFILSGKTAEQCPKNPLSPTSSVSGMVVGVIVGTEKVVNGVFSYFWYLGENSINQVIGLGSSFEGLIASYAIKGHTLIDGLLGAISGQIKMIYNGSTGSIRVLFDTIIKTENSAQKFVYNQVEKMADSVVSGKFTGGITSALRHPFTSIASGFKKVKSSVAKISLSITNDVKKVIDKVKTTGIPQDVKDIITAPVKGVQVFIKETQTVIQTVKNETSERIAGYSSEFKNGGIIDKVVALSSLPVGITLEAWSFTLKISGAFKKSVSASLKDIVQPFLGQVLTERLGVIINLPLDITEGFYKSTINFFSNIGGIVSKVTGGGSVSVQLNMVIMHPFVVLENAWNVTKQEAEDFSTAILGKELTAQLGTVLASPERAISSVVSSISGGKLGSALQSLVTKPLMFLGHVWTNTVMTVKGITKGIIGEKWTEKISDVLSAPGQAIANLTVSITGGGSIGTQIKTVLTSPIQTLKNVWTSIETTIRGVITFITGGGSLSTQISTVLTSPFTIVANIWTTTKEFTKSVSTSILGENLTHELGNAVNAPLQTLSNVTASITGGGSLGTQIKTVLSEPFVIIGTIWQKTKSVTESVSKTLFGGELSSKFGQLLSAPFETISKLFKYLTGGFSASIHLSADGSGGGGIGAAVSSLVQAPIYVVQGTYKGIVKATQSLVNSLKGFYASIPFIGRVKVDVAVKDGDEETRAKMSIGGGGGTESQSGGAKAEGSADGSGKSRQRRKPRYVL